MPEPPSPDTPNQDPPPRHAPSPLPPPFNARRQTPRPFVSPPAVQRHDTAGSSTSPHVRRGDTTPLADAGGPPDPRPPRSSNHLSTVGLVLFIVLVVVIGVSALVYNAGKAERGDDGAIAEAGTVYSDELDIGDCIEEIEVATAVGDVPGVPCAQPHVGEVVGTFELPGGKYPGEQEIFRAADMRCSGLLQSYAPDHAADASVGIAYLYPTERSWYENKRVTCIGTSVDGKPVSGRLTDP